MIFALSFYFRRRAIFLQQHVIGYSINNTQQSEAATRGVRNFIKMRLQHSYFSVKLANFLRTPILTTSANDCSCAVWFLSVVAYRCRNTKKKSLNWTFFSLPLNKKNPLCEEHFKESCFNKSVDLGKRLKAIKIYLWLISFLIYDI